MSMQRKDYPNKAIRVRMSNNTNEYIDYTDVMIDWHEVSIIQDVYNPNTESGRSVDRVELSSIAQIDELITMLKIARELYEEKTES